MPETQTFEAPDIIVQHQRGWRVRLYNDDVTPFDLVVLALELAAGLSDEIAEMVMLEAHNEGSAIVRSALTKADAEQMVVRLRQYSHVPGVCPGLHSEAERDDS